MHTLSDIRCRGKYLSPNTCLCLILDLIWFKFCDYQNIGLLRNINNIHKHYLYQQKCRTPSVELSREAAHWMFGVD